VEMDKAMSGKGVSSHHLVFNEPALLFVIAYFPFVGDRG